MGLETTEKAGHTKGPWHVGGDSDAIWVSPQNEGVNVICDIVGRVSGDEGFTEEDEANARLIAVCPGLLAECKETLDQMEDLYDGAPDSPTRWMGRRIDRLRAVIAQATGEGE